MPNASGNFESVLPSIALGVSSGSGGELSSQYNVRGGNYDENLVYVNDFEIFRPQLIRGGQQEGLSFPNIDLIRDLEFSSGGFESKYGDKMASVLDIRYKRPEEFRASVGASFLGASIHLEGSKRLGANAYNKFRYLLGARYKSNAYLLGSQDIKGEYVPRFSDIQAFLSYDLTKNITIRFYFQLQQKCV
ncbi:MAG: TonB-dependent receptor plug domain-containing protein [Saprospiraceae bacterium]|nr:TonB-dependent receptor plug domain-containing protein [Saprospiraceae bacterium]